MNIQQEANEIKQRYYRRMEKSAFKRVTLAPPIARRLSKFPLLIKVLTRIKVLNTHIIGFLQK
jgi:hypothetical protein